MAYEFSSNLAGENAGDAVVLAVADVFVGSYTLGSEDMRRPPPKEDGKLYDTTVDNIKIPSIFVKYNTNEYCPRYFINVKV